MTGWPRWGRKQFKYRTAWCSQHFSSKPTTHGRGAQNVQLEQSKDKTRQHLVAYSSLILEIDDDIVSYTFKSRHLMHSVGNVIIARSDHNKQRNSIQPRAVFNICYATPCKNLTLPRYYGNCEVHTRVLSLLITTWRHLGNTGKAPPIFNHKMSVSSQPHAPTALHPGKDTQYPLHSRLYPAHNNFIHRSSLRDKNAQLELGPRQAATPYSVLWPLWNYHTQHGSKNNCLSLNYLIHLM